MTPTTPVSEDLVCDLSSKVSAVAVAVERHSTGAEVVVALR